MQNRAPDQLYCWTRNTAYMRNKVPINATLISISLGILLSLDIDHRAFAGVQIAVKAEMSTPSKAFTIAAAP